MRKVSYLTRCFHIIDRVNKIIVTDDKLEKKKTFRNTMEQVVCVCGLCLFSRIQIGNLLLAVEGDFIKNRDTRKCLKNYAKKRIEELTKVQGLSYKEDLDVLEDLKVCKNLIKEISYYGICENLLGTFERLKNNNGRLHQDLDDNFYRQLKIVSPAVVIKNDDNWYRKERLITQCLHNATQKYCTNVFIHPVTVEYRELMKSKLQRDEIR